MSEVLIIKYYKAYQLREKHQQIKRALTSKSEIEKIRQTFINDTLKIKGFSFKVVATIHELNGEKFVIGLPLKDNLNTYDILKLTRGKSATIEMQKL